MIIPYKNLDESLADYVWKGDGGGAITKVIKYSDKAASINGHNLLLINSNLVENKGVITEGYPNITKVIEYLMPEQFLDFKLDCERLTKVLESTEKDKDYLWEECEVCGGSGFSLDAGDGYRCNVCKGEGEVATDEIIKEYYFFTNLFKIGNRYIQFNYIEKFLKLYPLIHNIKFYECKDVIKITFDEGELYIVMVVLNESTVYNIVDLN